MSSKRSGGDIARSEAAGNGVAKWITLCLSSPNPQMRPKPVIPVLAESGSNKEKNKSKKRLRVGWSQGV